MTFQQVRQYVKGIISTLDIKKIVSDEISDTLYDNTKTGFTPVGTIITVMGNEAPRHYLKCEGQIVNIADYVELADYFKQQFGSVDYFGGDGTTTFGIPDLRGEFLRGTGTNSHTNGGVGTIVGTHQEPTVHGLAGTDMSWGGFPFVTSDIKNTWDVHIPSSKIGYSQNGITANNDDSGRATFYTSRPTNTSVLYCIATKNIYLNPSLDYSTNEKVVGHWIDGKPLYQKTINCGSGPNKTTKEVAHNISNFGTLIHQEYRLTLGDGNQLTMTNFYGSDKIFAEATATAGYINYAIQASVNATNIRIMARDVDYSTMTNIYATLQYTKTTD